MRFESHAERILDTVDDAFSAALDDTLTDAREIAARNARTGKFARSLEVTDPTRTADGLEARIGSPLSSARAKEKGAFIEAKTGEFLVFNAGDGVRKVKAVRLAPQPVVTPAARGFGGHMTDRLREGFR